MEEIYWLWQKKYRWVCHGVGFVSACIEPSNSTSQINLIVTQYRWLIGTKPRQYMHKQTKTMTQRQVDMQVQATYR